MKAYVLCSYNGYAVPQCQSKAIILKELGRDVSREAHFLLGGPGQWGILVHLLGF